MTRMIVAVALAIVAFSALPSCTFNTSNSQSNETARELRVLTTTAAPSKPIEVRTKSGKVEIVRVDNRGDVRVEATIRAGGSTTEEATSRLAEIVATAERNESGVLVEATFPEKRRGNDGCSFRIEVPAAVGVVVRSSNGSVILEKLGGEAKVRTSNGKIDIRRHDGGLDLETSNGSVTIVGGHTAPTVDLSDGRMTVKGSRGDVRVKTSNGRVEISEVSGAIDIKTSNGKVKVIAPLRLDVVTSNGSVHARLLASSRRGFDVRTSNGRVDVEVSPSCGGKIHVSTSNGKIRTSGDVKRYDGDRRDGVVVISEDGPKSRIDTSNASVNIDVR